MTPHSKRSVVYTKGELNQVIDSLIHPLAKKDPRFILLDGIFHAIIEENPTESIMKFLRYNAPILFKEFSCSTKPGNQSSRKRAEIKL